MKKRIQNRPLDQELEMMIKKIYQERYVWLSTPDSKDNRGMAHRRMTQNYRQELENR